MNHFWSKTGVKPNLFWQKSLKIFAAAVLEISSIGETGFGCTNLSCSTSVEKLGLKLAKASSTPNASSFGFWDPVWAEEIGGDDGDGIAGVSHETLNDGAKSDDIDLKFDQ